MQLCRPLRLPGLLMQLCCPLRLPALLLATPPGMAAACRGLLLRLWLLVPARLTPARQHLPARQRAVRLELGLSLKRTRWQQRLGWEQNPVLLLLCLLQQLLLRQAASQEVNMTRHLWQQQNLSLLRLLLGHRASTCKHRWRQLERQQDLTLLPRLLLGQAAARGGTTTLWPSHRLHQLPHSSRPGRHQQKPSLEPSQ